MEASLAIFICGGRKLASGAVARGETTLPPLKTGTAVIPEEDCSIIFRFQSLLGPKKGFFHD